jgi:hypothetical protein
MLIAPTNFVFKRLFNVKLIYSIQILGPWLWGNKPFVFFSGGAEEGAKWGKCPTSPCILKNALRATLGEAKLYSLYNIYTQVFICLYDNIGTL